jgi:cytosine deaminase
MCTGTIIQFGISRVVVAESKNFKGFQDVLSLAGVNVVDAHEERCEHMMAKFIADPPDLWNEDIGE